jgi:Ca2+-binding EF-hand superfamily protein
MYKHGRNHLLDFGDDEIKKLKECFCSLDEDGEGTISLEELETPLIGLGFADTREEVEEMVNEVDEDGSGEIEFDEFLLIIKNSNTKNKRSKINQFFKDMTNNSIGVKGSENLSFGMVV